jgi:ATP-dependent RNA helicase SUPV3L1/SUV3
MALEHHTIQHAAGITKLSKTARTAYTELQESLPAYAKDLWPEARRTQEQWEAWIGPTNSGKTHAALQDLSRAISGRYLGPLRILAQEVQEKLETQGTITNLHTGEETVTRQHALHTSATVEMAETEVIHQVAVIDEAQMIDDDYRGSAWTRAILGSSAKRLLICAAPNAKAAIVQLAEYANIPLTIHHVERKTPLITQDKPTSLHKAPSGTLLIAFSRNKVLEIADNLRARGRRVATIYGSMPPEIRRHESQRFLSGNADIVIATDAVGMGINIPVEGVIFTAASKFDGNWTRLLNPEEVKQLAGRAGRFGLHESGWVCGADDRIHAHVVKMMTEQTEPVVAPFAVLPDWPIIERASAILRTKSLESCLSESIHAIAQDPIIRKNTNAQVLDIAARLDSFHPGFDLHTRYMLSKAPLCKTTEALFWSWLTNIWLSTKGEGTAIRMTSGQTMLKRFDTSKLEQYAAEIALYRWLATRLPHLFPDAEAATDEYKQVIDATKRKIA